jgi:hypothetical protein
MHSPRQASGVNNTERSAMPLQNYYTPNTTPTSNERKKIVQLLGTHILSAGSSTQNQQRTLFNFKRYHTYLSTKYPKIILDAMSLERVAKIWAQKRLNQSN